MRVLSGESIREVEWLFEANGWVLPAPGTAKIVIEEDANGDIVGLCTLAIVPHLEPIWVAKSHRGTGVADRLALEAVEEFRRMNIPRWVSVVANDQSKRLATMLNMTPVYGEVWVHNG